MKVSNLSWKRQEWKYVSSEFFIIAHSICIRFSRTKQQDIHKNHLSHIFMI